MEQPIETSTPVSGHAKLKQGTGDVVDARFLLLQLIMSTVNVDLSIAWTLTAMPDKGVISGHPYD